MIFEKKISDIYKSQLFARYDDNGVLKYFTHHDFPGLKAEKYSFKSSKGYTLCGYFYGYDNKNTEKLIIFEHGLGGGHLSYMKEIEKLCANGYYVFAYDHTGCMESEGENAGGFAQSLRDLDDCIKALKADKEVNSSDLAVIGHSRGGLAALNIPALHSDVKKIVALSAPISVYAMLKQNFKGILSGYRKVIMKLEHEANGEYTDYDAVKTLSDSDVMALLIYSDNDPLVHKKYHYDVLYSALCDKPNVEFVLEIGKGHNPNYAYEATVELSALSKALRKAIPKTEEEKASFKASFDWDKMTEQDDEVWNRIYEFLNK